MNDQKFTPPNTFQIIHITVDFIAICLVMYYCSSKVSAVREENDALRSDVEAIKAAIGKQNAAMTNIFQHINGGGVGGGGNAGGNGGGSGGRREDDGERRRDNRRRRSPKRDETTSDEESSDDEIVISSSDEESEERRPKTKNSKK